MGQAPRTAPDIFKHLKKSLVLTFRDSVGEYQPTSRKATKNNQITTDMKQKTKPKEKKPKKPAYFNADTGRCPITGLKPSRDRRVGKKEYV